MSPGSLVCRSGAGALANRAARRATPQLEAQRAARREWGQCFLSNVRQSTNQPGSSLIYPSDRTRRLRPSSLVLEINLMAAPAKSAGVWGAEGAKAALAEVAARMSDAATPAASPD